MSAALPLEVLALLAFGAGVLALFSPCSIAMMPAYLAYYMVSTEGPKAPGAGGKAGWTTPVGASLVVASGGLMLYALADGVRRGLVAFAPGQSPGVFLGLVLLPLGLTLLILSLARTATVGDRGTVVPRAVTVAGLTTAGLVAAFVGLGLAIVGGAAAVQGYLPWVVPAIAIAVVILGILMVLGRAPTSIPSLRARPGNALTSFFTLGIAYALVSTGCNLPVFLLVVGLGLQAAVASPAGAVVVFLAYGAGAASVLLLVTVSTALARATTAPWVRRLTPWLGRTTGLVVASMGLVVLWYDLAP